MLQHPTRLTKHFHAIHPEDMSCQPFAAFPPDARLAILIGLRDDSR